MIGKLYEQTVAEGILAATHGAYETIKEIYIPELNICFNERGYAFRPDDSRFTTIEERNKKEEEDHKQFFEENKVPKEQRTLYRSLDWNRSGAVFIKEVNVPDELAKHINAMIEYQAIGKRAINEYFGMKDEEI